MSTEIHDSGLALAPVQTLSEAAAGIGAIGAADIHGSGAALPAGITVPQGKAAAKPLPALADLLTKEVPVNYFGVFHMLVAFLGMTASTLMILFVDSMVAFPLCLAIYLGMTAYEAKNGIYSPLSFTLVAAYAVMYGLMLRDSYYLPYVGLGTFALLALMSIVLFAIGRPLTTFYTHEHGSRFFHRLISGIWLGAFALAFLSGWLLMPDLLYLFVPFGICFCTCAFVIYLSFFDTKLITRRQKEYTKGAFTFKQIAYPSKEYDEYIDLYSGILIRDVYGEDKYDEEKTLEMKNGIREYDGITSQRKVIFGAYRDGRLIGTMGIALDAKEKPFPIEDVMECSLDPMRKLGKIVVIGRFCIEKQYRATADVIEGLFKSVFEYAVEHDTSFIVAEVLHNTSAYARLGFESLMPRSDPRFKNLSTPGMGSFQVLINNMAQGMFFAKKEALSQSLNMFNDINELLTERWVKRQVVRHAFSARAKRPWMHTMSSLRLQLGLALGRRARS